MADDPLPDAHSGLPKPVERLLMRPYADSARGRIGASAALRALGVLVRKHPKAAFDMVTAGAAQAGRTGLTEIKGKLFGRKPAKTSDELPARLVQEARAQLAEELGEDELQKIRQMLDKEGHERER